MAKKKYSYSERAKYHKDKYGKFVDKFRSKEGAITNIEYANLSAAEKRNPRIQYSSGFSDFAIGIQRGYIKPEADLKKESKSFQKGYSAARKAFDKSQRIKF